MAAKYDTAEPITGLDDAVNRIAETIQRDLRSTRTSEGFDLSLEEASAIARNVIDAFTAGGIRMMTKSQWDKAETNFHVASLDTEIRQSQARP